MHFENTTYNVLHENNNNTASFAEDLKFIGKSTFVHTFWLNSGKSKKTTATRIREIYILKILYTRCSTKVLTF